MSKSTKLDLGATLYALDTRNKDYYTNLSDDDKKKYAALVLMRFMSQAPDSNGLHEYHVETINDVVNKDFWTLSKHPELQHLLLSMCGIGSKQYHTWIPNPQKSSKNLLQDFLQKALGNCTVIEQDIAISKFSEEEFEELLNTHGVQTDDKKKILKQLKEAKKNYESTAKQ